MNASIIEDRINFLTECAKDEGEEIKESSVRSFRSFIEWGIVHGNFLDEPILSLTPNNEIYATWEQGKKHCFLFRNDGSIKYLTVNGGGHE